MATRDAIPPLLALDNLVDLVIPRGGNELVRYVKSATKIPVLGHADGLCIGYLERTAPRDLAVRVLLDAKTGYPAACNSLETLLVDQALLDPAQGSGGLWPTVAEALVQAGVELRCDAATKAALPAALLESPKVVDVQPADYDTEHLALVLTVAAVPTADAAIAHINTHGSHHTDVILTSDEALAERFLSAVDSAGVYWNASTRLADGFRYGFGTEVGISTNKIHARGPVGLEGLTIYKYKLRGKGQTAGEFGLGEGKRAFLHEKLPLD